MKKYDVLMLCQFFYPEKVSSAVLPYETAEDLVKKGLKVKVVCGCPKETAKNRIPKKDVVNGIEIRRIDYLHLSKASKVGRLVNYSSLLLSMFFHWPLLIRSKCLLVYSNPPILPLIASINKSLFKVNYIFVCYDVYPDIAVVTKHLTKKSFTYKLMLRINRRMDNNVNKVITLSNDMKAYIQATRKSISADRITVISNWYDNQNVGRSEEIIDVEIKRMKSKYKLIILYSGNMGICQDVDTLLESAKQLSGNKDILFIFTGFGQKEKRLKAEALECNLSNVEFYGFLSGHKYIDMLKVADVHVVSLVSGVEGMCVPSKTYSYMAIGRPLIAIMSESTDIAKDIYDHGLGYVVEPGDSEKLSEYISYMSRNEDEAQQMGDRALSVFNANYRREMNTDKYYRVIKDIINYKKDCEICLMGKRY